MPSTNSRLNFASAPVGEGLVDISVLPATLESWERAPSAVTDEEVLARARRNALETAKTLALQVKDVEEFEVDVVARQTEQGGEIRHYVLEKDRIKIIISYRENQRPQIEAYDKGRLSRISALLHAQILRVVEKIESSYIGFDNESGPESYSHDDAVGAVDLESVIEPCPVYPLPVKPGSTAAIETLLAQYRLTLGKSGFVDDLDDDLLAMGTAAGLTEDAVKNEMAERAVTLFLHGLDPQSGSMLKFSRARKMLDFVGRIGVERIKASVGFKALHDTVERILASPVPKDDPLKMAIGETYSRMLTWSR
jgi:hypothetical protein